MNEILVLLLGSTVVGKLLSNFHTTRIKRRELIAGATKSALRRVEMYYRILRRTDDVNDERAIRDLFHDIQEENEYYASLLAIEAAWLGDSYTNFIEAIKSQTMNKIQAAWETDGVGPGAKLQNIDHPDVKAYIQVFTRDSRRLFNPLMRIVMRLKFILRKYIKDNGYGSR